jgi:drug/metabolite transporter (DMT)-like permease
MKNQTKAYLYAALSVMCWSTVATAFKLSLRELDYAQLLLFSSFTSLVVLFIILSLQKKLKQLKGSTSKLLIQSALLGFLNPFIYYIVLFKAYSLLPAQLAQPLNYTWGVMLVLLSIPILRQRIRLVSIIAVFISFIGVIIISTRGTIFNWSSFNALGIALALGSSMIWALYWLFNVKDKRDELIKLFLNFIFGFVFILIYNLIFERVSFPGINGLLSAAYVGTFEMGITYVFWLKALKLSKTTASVSTIIYLSPFISLIFIHFVLHEQILFTSFIGLVFIVGGIIIQQLASFKNHERLKI